MKVYETLFCSLYALNKRLDPNPDKSILPAFALMTILAGFNLQAVYVAAYAITRTKLLGFSDDLTYVSFFVIPLVIWTLLILRRRRFEKILAEFQNMAERRKRALWILGIAYACLTVVCSVGSFLLLAN